MQDFDAYLEDFHTITILFRKNWEELPPFRLVHGGKSHHLHIVDRQEAEHHLKLVGRSDSPIHPHIPYHLEDDEGGRTKLKSGHVVRTEEFDRHYHYEGDDLGVTYEKERSTFKVWTPIAREVKLLLRRGETIEEFPLRYKDGGVWSCTIAGDLEKTPYRFRASINGKERTFTDPYAIAGNANGEWNYVVDPEHLVTMQNERAVFRNEPSIIYEASVRDLTMDPALQTKERGTFMGASEKDLRTEEGREAGFDHIRSLGVTHVQFLPFFDFEGVDERRPKEAYNWGYNPSQYNVPEGSYASDPDDPYARIDELRKMIDVYHGEGLGVVMDVVYNHVYDPKTHPFGKMVPGYFFRVDNHGHLTAASGCENDLATERRMVRKFIVDSLRFWAETYRLDGFRFDLMGLIDTDTMHAAKDALKEIDENILLYGEGWNMPTVLPKKKLCHMDNKHVSSAIGFFNDIFRETVKGSTFAIAKKGFAMGAKISERTMARILRGSSASKPALERPCQSLNYVECHDNHTFFDKAQIAMEKVAPRDRLRAQKLATAIVILAQGVPFLHAGQEFYRTKKGDKDSYMSPDHINRIDWSLLDRHHRDTEDVRRLIRLKKDHPLFWLQDKDEIRKQTSVETKRSGTVLYRLRDKDEHILVIFKNNPDPEHFRFKKAARILFHSETDIAEGPRKELELTRISTTVMKLGKDEHA